MVLRRVLRLRRPALVASGALLALVLMSTALAQEEEADPIADLAGDLNNGWLMITAFIVFFMQAGFAMVESGFTRSKNTTNILMKNMLDACVGGLLFFAIGWAIAYGVDDEGSAGGFMGNGQWFLNDFDAWPMWIFQFAFAATAATIVSGAMAERTKFGAYLVYTAFISGIVYPFVVHWAWDVNGWMTAFTDDPFMANGYIDFAGSGVVHMVGGAAGLVGAAVVGPRLGRFSKDGSSNPIPGHNIALGALGVLILWFGWYGFNPGSTLGLSGGFSEIAGKVAVNTTLAACAAAVTGLIVTKVRYGKYDAGLMMNGVLGGLVGITAGCATVEPIGAVIIGAIAFLVVMLVVDVLDMVKIDDPVGAVPVHLGAGLWGVIAVGLFSSEGGIAFAGYGDSDYGLFYGGGASQLMAQLIGAGAILAWTVGLSAILFIGIKMTMGLRVSEKEEIEGLDLGEHGMSAYPEFAAGQYITSTGGNGGGGS
ncbi:MAG: ammonium transporter [Tepidiformaceae bacterium]